MCRVSYRLPVVLHTVAAAPIAKLGAFPADGYTPQCRRRIGSLAVAKGRQFADVGLLVSYVAT
jgi:hypothetical protein